MVFGSPLYNAMWGPSEFSARGTLKSYERADRLGEITVPTLFTYGEHDEATPAVCREVAAAIPAAAVAVIAEASHFTCAGQPEAYIAALRHFLAGIG